MNDLEKYLTSKEDCGGTSAEELRHMGKTAAIRYVREKTPLNTTISSMAKEAHLNTEQVKRVVEHANNTTFSTLFQAGFSTKNIQFPMADANAILHESTHKEKTASMSTLLPTKGRYIPGQERASVNDLFFDTEERMCHECLNQEYCEHDNKVYQPAEPDNNVPEDYNCEDCGKSFDVPEPSFDTLWHRRIN